MADLKPLIRLRRHSVEEKQKTIAALYRDIEALEDKREELRQRLEDERKIFEQQTEMDMRPYFGVFQEGIQKNVEAINGQISKLEARLRILQEDLREAFADMKRVEIVQRNREKKEAKKQAKKETTELDEIGIEGFRRKEEV